MSRLKVKHSNPEGLFDSRVFSQVVTVSGNAKTIYIGGQNAINSEGQLIGRDNLELQTKQVLEINVLNYLTSSPKATAECPHTLLSLECSPIQRLFSYRQ